MKVAEDLRRAVLQAGIEGRLTGGRCEGWRFVRLGECALVGSGKTPQKDFLSSNGTIPFYRVADMNLPGNKKIMNEANTFLTEKYNGKLTPFPCVIFPKNGGAIFTNKRRFLNKPALIDLNTGFIFPLDDIDIEYLFYWFSSIDLSRYAIGTALPTVNATIISNLIIPLPPLNEQHRIVSHLDSILPLIAELESAENELEALERKFPGDMRDSLIQAAIEGRLTGNNTDNWRYVRLGDVITKDIGGGTPDKSVAEYWNGNIPWMSVKDFARANDGFIEDTIDHISEQGLEHSATNLIMPGAIIICMRMGLGKYARLKRPTAINQDLRAIWLSEDVLADYFLYFYSTLKIEGIGTTVKGIKRNELLSYIISLPPINEQQKIVSRLNDLLPLCEALERII